MSPTHQPLRFHSDDKCVSSVDIFLRNVLKMLQSHLKPWVKVLGDEVTQESPVGRDYTLSQRRCTFEVSLSPIPKKIVCMSNLHHFQCCYCHIWDYAAENFGIYFKTLMNTVKKLKF